jgi:RNA polymerase sigma factor (TIGR02999 family)
VADGSPSTSQDEDPGNVDGAARLLPLVYDELRRLAAQKLASERPGHTLQATALVHEAYLRLAGAKHTAGHWHGRAHFFAAAAEAMRRILIDNARRRAALCHGGGRQQVDLDDALASITSPTATVSDNADDLIALDAALTQLESEDKSKSEVVKLHFFVGLSLEDAADALGISRATAYRHWTYARAWLRDRIRAGNP